METPSAASCCCSSSELAEERRLPQHPQHSGTDKEAPLTTTRRMSHRSQSRRPGRKRRISTQPYTTTEATTSINRNHCGGCDRGLSPRFFLLLLSIQCLVSRSLGRELAATTESGYDAIGGTDAICWETHVHEFHSYSKKHEHGEDPDDHPEGEEEEEVALKLPSCPGETKLELTVEEEVLLRAKQRYTYHVDVELDMPSILNQTSRMASNDNTSSWELASTPDGIAIAVRVAFCPIGAFCMPFLEVDHDHLVSGIGIVGHEDDEDHDAHGGEFHHDQEEDHKEHKHAHDNGHRRILLESEHHGEHGNEDAASDRHDEHVHKDSEAFASEYIVISKETVDEWMNEEHYSGVLAFHLDFRLSVPIRGHFVPMSSVHLFFQSTSNNETLRSIEDITSAMADHNVYRFDVANLLADRSLLFSTPMEILAIEPSMAILSYTIVGITGLAQLAMLLATIFYRKDGVMRLSQGGFLVLLQLSGLVATSSSFLYNGSTDVHCFLQSPMVLIPIQLMLAIMFGRLRRIIQIMSPLIEWEESTDLSVDSGVSCRRSRRRRNVRQGLRTWKTMMLFGRSSTTGSSNDSHSRSRSSGQASSTGDERNTLSQGQKTPSGSNWVCTMKDSRQRIRRLRQTFTAGRLWIVIAVVTLPIVVVVAVGLVVFPPYRQLTLNDEQSVGRYECGGSESQIYQLSSTAVVFLTMFLVLYEAHQSRRLPALFNEVGQVASGVLMSLFVAVLAFAVIIITENPSTSPSIPYIVKVILVCIVSLNTSARLVVPKLRLIWKGEKVVISKILTDHKASKRKNDKSKAEATQMFALSGSFSPEEEKDTDEHMNNSVKEMSPATQSGLGDEETGTAKGDDVGHTLPFESDHQLPTDESSSGRSSHSAKVPSDHPLPDVEQATSQDGSRDDCPSALVLSQGASPPSKLMVGILSHYKTISRLNERILSGLQVDRSSWEELKVSVEELEELLERVEYA